MVNKGYNIAVQEVENRSGITFDIGKNGYIVGANPTPRRLIPRD